MRARLTLTSSVVGAVIVAFDGTVLTVAQPALRRDPALPRAVLAGLALAGAATGRMMPGRRGTTIDDHGQSGDRTRVPARR